MDRREPTRTQELEPTPSPTKRDASDVGEPARTSPLAMELRERVVPRLEEMAIRLRASGHRTLLDDRLKGAPAVLRFRLAPRRGPFDDPPKVAGSVLEIAVIEESVVSVRHWLDPLADQPSEEYRMMAATIGAGWADGVLLEFAESVLGSD